ncbi:hypothetical protein ACIHCQ_28120 [Streptomyces sp. NPDC052236]|uniref:hypothetical protein n=1 Tax=Streptomyces sp. NPDC052236 TaxID=3365686 RepID=UPI0037D396E2
MGLQLAKGLGDTDLALREALGQFLDRDPLPGGQRLDVYGQPDGDEGQFSVLREVVSDHGESVRVAAIDVPYAGRGNGGRGAQGRVKLLLSHREASSSLVVRPSIGIAVPAGGRRMSAVVEPEPASPHGICASQIGPDHSCE